MGPSAKESAPVFRPGLKDKSGAIRMVTASALFQMGVDEDTALDVLSKGLSQKDSNVERSESTHCVAMDAMFDVIKKSRVKAKVAVPALIKALGDKDVFFRHDAAVALGRIGPDARRLFLRCCSVH